MLPVRLHPRDLEIILKTFTRFFGPEDHLWLFGSRADPSKKGGDIDLYIESSLPNEDAFNARLKFGAALYLELEEQKVDIVLNLLGTSTELPIYQVAKTTGVLLK